MLASWGSVALYTARAESAQGKQSNPNRQRPEDPAATVKRFAWHAHASFASLTLGHKHPLNEARDTQLHKGSSSFPPCSQLGVSISCAGSRACMILRPHQTSATTIPPHRHTLMQSTSREPARLLCACCLGCGAPWLLIITSSPFPFPFPSPTHLT